MASQHVQGTAMKDVQVDRPSLIDRVPSDRFPVYTRANVGEIWPGPATPLTYTTQAGMRFDQAWRKALVRFGAFDLDEFDPDHEVFIGVFYGYPYLNVSVQRVFGVRMPGATPELIDESFFGGQEGVPPYEPDPRDQSPEHTERVTQRIGGILATTELPHLDVEERKLVELRASRPDHTSSSIQDLWAYAEPLITSWFGELMDEHMFTTTAGAIPVGIVQATAASLGDPGLAVRALGGYGDVASVAPTYAMWELGRSIAKSPELTAIFDDGVPGVLDRLRASTDPEAATFLERFENFLARFGSRGTNEMDLGAPTWETQPEIALAAIERLRLQPDTASPRETLIRLAHDREVVSKEMLERLAHDPAAQGQLEAGLRAAALWLPARERTKFATVRLQHEARMALLELGRRMVDEGVFEAGVDFVLLTRDEFPRFLKDPQAWATEIRRRRLWLDSMNELQAPFITVGAPPPPSTWRPRTQHELPPVEVGEVITGIAACSGTATGTARVITDPVEAGDLQPCDVLVAASTDPSWTPLFLSATAVVVDVGAPMSHAAIVSRELGVPCVVSATAASLRIPDGATITVDGTNGSVTVESLAP